MLIKSRFSFFVLIAYALQMTVPFAVPAQPTAGSNARRKPADRKACRAGHRQRRLHQAKALPNPTNDATDMAAALSALGFEVISGVNQSKRQMETLIRDFGTKLSAAGGTGLFYYAGHGIQVGGENYLVPVEADIPEEDEVSYSAVPVSLVLTKMSSAKNDLNIVILDACRNNPFARSWRSFRDSSNSDGLAKISPPTGTLVLYATEPGKVASDGAARNGLFTEALLKQINRPNLNTTSWSRLFRPTSGRARTSNNCRGKRGIRCRISISSRDRAV
ncbi:MAG: caspase family protein [Acidobacteria bacterium]|nr:caspase family protein [Acidobacteriota bacterium]